MHSNFTDGGTIAFIIATLVALAAGPLRGIGRSPLRPMRAGAIAFAFWYGEEDIV